MIRRLLALIAAVVLSWLGVLAALSAATAAEPPSASTSSYSPRALLDNHTSAPSDRGPPEARDRATTYDAVDRWSYGDLVRPSTASAPGLFAYDHPTPLGRNASVAFTMRGPCGEAAWDSVGRKPAGVAAKGAGEAGALVRYDAPAASRNLLGQVGEGYARTPSGYTVSAHAAERIVYGAPGRSPTTLGRIDDILNNPTRSVMRPDGSIRVFQGKDWVAVRGSGPIHIITVMVR